MTGTLNFHGTSTPKTRLGSQTGQKQSPNGTFIISNENRNTANIGLKSDTTLDFGMPTTATTTSSDIFTRNNNNPSSQKGGNRAQSNAPAPPSSHGQHPDRIQALNRANNGGRPTINGPPRALTGTRQSMPASRTTTYTNGFSNQTQTTNLFGVNKPVH